MKTNEFLKLQRMPLLNRLAYIHKYYPCPSCGSRNIGYLGEFFGCQSCFKLYIKRVKGYKRACVLKDMIK